MPSDKFKFSAKNGVVAPVIKKLYNSHKKLLGKTSTPNKTDHRSKEIAKPRQNPSKSTQAPINENHVYENVGFTSNTIEKMDSFSEEVFAGVNLSLSSLNLDGESSFSNSTNGVDSDISYPGLSSDCSTLTNYEETDSSISSITCTTPTSNTIKSPVADKKDNLKIIVKNKPNSDLDNITIIEIDDMKEKLKTAIDNFDRILNEYTPSAKQSQPKPKLQKSKTCSIIESKCILKKTLSDSSSAQISFNSLNLTQITTKSLCHLDRDIDDASSEVNQKKLMETQKFLSEIDFWKVSDAKKKNLKESCQKGGKVDGPEDVKQIKVKDVVKRLNSLSSDDEKKTSNVKKVPNNKHQLQSSNKTLTRKKSDGKDKPNQKSVSNYKPPLQKSLSNEKKSIKANKVEKPISSSKTAKEIKKDLPKQPLKIKPPPSNSKPVEIKQSLIPRAVSCYDVSNFNKKPLVSKIPIKTNLNRTFPSTPGNLNAIIDSTMRCTEIRFDEKSQSVQNLTGRINQIEKKQGICAKRLVNVDLERTVSCQNLTKSKTISEEYKINLSSNINGRKVLARTISGDLTSSTTKAMDEIVNQAKMINLADKNDEEGQMDCSKLNKDLELPEIKKKLVRNLTYNKGSNGHIKPKSEIVTDEEKEIVRQFLEGFQKEDHPSRAQKIKDVKKIDTFGVKKSCVEANFAQIDATKKKPSYSNVSTIRKNTLKRSDTYSKNQRIKEFQAIEKIEQNLKTAKEFFIKTNFTSCEIINNSSYIKASCVLNVEDSFGLGNSEAEADVRKAEEILKVIPKISADEVDFSNNICSDKNKDYLSDDNSDDSGNISNELELEYEEVPRVTRSRTSFSSSEPFLKKNSDQIYTAKGADKIFFRNGVLTQLESQRDEKLAGMVVNLQAHCRGYLARKKLSQRKLQDLAVRCIQRNVRKFLLVRDWPWWRLLVRVTPLLNVHRTEEELKLKTEELELLKAKLEKLESERVSLKHHNDKLEAKLSEMTADLAEEHSTSTLAAERLDAETADRIRLERELTEVQQKNKDLHNASERLEMELLYARSELNGISEDDDDPESEAVYKQRYERAMRELEFTKRRLQQQHEDDLEQLVGLKKQLEKKLTDAYEEVEEQRQVVGQWKRKVQKLNGEMNDLKLLLEEQSGRNNLLEKKQRKFDSELQLLQDELKKEKQAKERLSREKEVIIAEKFTLESNVADLRLEVDLKDEKLASIQKEVDELTYGGKTEEEVTLLRKQKIDCERRLHDQEEELDELAGQVQLLEQAKLKLEMNLEQQRKTAKKETQQHEEELEEVRCNAQKKVKALEAQLENEHEERTVLLREKHELERRLTAALENDRSEKACDEAVLQRLKRDLKRTKALLRDTQAQLERQKAENPSKTLIRQLKNQIEDLECARSAAVKTKQILEGDLSETQAQLEETVRQKNEIEEKANAVNREKADLQLQVEENEEELAEVLKKYKTTIQQMSLDQLALQEQVSLVGELEAERNNLKEQLAELTSKLDSLENAGDATSNILVKRTELKVKELESKLDLEQTTRTRLEVQISRLKEAVEKLQHDLVTSRTKEQSAQDQIRKLQRSLRELRDEHNNALTKESESLLKRKELEKRYEALEAESSTVRADLRLALKRIEDLQAVIQNDLEDSTENSDSEHDSYSSDDSVNTFLANHKISSKSSSMQFENQRRLSSTSRSSTSSNLTKDSSYA